MADGEVQAANNALDDAVAAWASVVKPGLMVTGWVMAGVAVRPSELDDDVSSYFQARSPGLPFHAMLGLLSSSIQDMHDDARRDNEG